MSFWNSVDSWLSLHQGNDERECELIAYIQQRERTGVGRFREQCAPGHVTASALVLHPHKAAVALVMHPVFGWIQPGGHVDEKDESLIDCAHREVLEECGLVAGLIGECPLLDITQYAVPPNLKKREIAHLHFDFRFLMKATVHHLSDGARWVSCSDALLVDDPSVRLGVQRLCAKLGWHS